MAVDNARTACSLLAYLKGLRNRPTLRMELRKAYVTVLESWSAKVAKITSSFQKTGAFRTVAEKMQLSPNTSNFAKVVNLHV